MTHLIEELKAEHRKILDFFIDIELTQNFGEKKVLLQKLATLSEHHFKLEDGQLYPVLRKAEDVEIRNMGIAFSDAMQGYYKIFVAVLEEALKQDGALNAELTKSYEDIEKKIKNRITLEELLLFPAYEKCV